MRYEVTERYEDKGQHNPFGFSDGTPMAVRIHPEETPAKVVLTSMVMAAYSMDGTPGVWGLATLEEPNEITAKEALEYLRYDEGDQRSRWQRVARGVPDTRVPSAVTTDNIRSRAVKVRAYRSKEVDEAYDMNTHVFIADVGSIDVLFEKTEELIPIVEQELRKPVPFYRRLFLGESNHLDPAPNK